MLHHERHLEINFPAWQGCSQPSPLYDALRMASHYYMCGHWLSCIPATRTTVGFTVKAQPWTEPNLKNDPLFCSPNEFQDIVEGWASCWEYFQRMYWANQFSPFSRERPTLFIILYIPELFDPFTCKNERPTVQNYPQVLKFSPKFL
jgi:hypothetical protein